MNAPTKIKHSLQAVATALTEGDYTLLPDGDYSAYTDERWACEAQCYLDNLADGCDDAETREELLGMIAEGIAREEYDCAAFRHDMHQSGWHSDMIPFGDWFEPDRDYYVSRVGQQVAA